MKCPNKCGNQMVTPDGPGFTTLVYYPPIYNELGVNTNLDRNTITSSWKCLNCGCRWTEANGEVVGEIKLKENLKQ